MVAPFCGTAFGGWLYDMFLYVDESPINTPWIGLKRAIFFNQQKTRTREDEV
jgi:hypothetical protein